MNDIIETLGTFLVYVIGAILIFAPSILVIIALIKFIFN